MQTRFPVPALLALLAAVALAVGTTRLATGLAAAPVSPSTLESIIESIVPDDDVGEEMCRGLAKVAAPV